jgi:hypothetical protein
MEKEDRVSHELLWIAGIVAVWFIINRFVLPRFGVST